MTIGFNAIVGPNDTSSGGGGGGTTVLTSDRTYYVRADGSDSNDGLSDTAAGAFASYSYALGIASLLFCGPYQLTIQIGTATWTPVIALPRIVYGTKIPILQGTGAANTIFAANSASATVGADGTTPWIIQNFKVSNSGAATFLVAALNGSILKFGGLDIGAFTSGGYQVYADKPSSIVAVANYTVSGGAGQAHFLAAGLINVSGRTINIAGAPNFSGQFAYAANGYLNCFGVTFNGTATGQRYRVDQNGVIFTNGGGATFFPGDAAGTTQTGGQYI